MVGTITPVVNRSNKGKQIVIILLPHIVGYIIGASVLGLLCGIIGRLTYKWLPFLNNMALIIFTASVIGLIMTYSEVLLGQCQRPQSTWQVPGAWRVKYPLSLMAFLYGVILGMGIFTRITSYSYYIILAYALLIGDLMNSTICMSIYGVGRGLPVMIFSLMKPQDNYRLVATITRFQILVPPINGIVSGFLTCSMLARAL
jgi:cytochrome c biogenesis protein CcdA